MDARHRALGVAAGILAACAEPDGPADGEETGEVRESAPPDTSDPDDTGTAAPCGAADTSPCGSCAALLAAWPLTPDGPAALEVDGVPVDALCDMTTAGGGWTLAGTNAWTGVWDVASVLDGSVFGEPSLAADYKGAGFGSVPFADLLFETDEEYAVYLGVGDGSLSYLAFQDTVPLYNCGIGTPYEWEMAEGNLDDPDICSTNLYIHPVDWEGGTLPCGDSEVGTGPAWSAQNKDLGCPLNDPMGYTFISDPWDYNVWGDHDPAVPNLPLRMWVR